MELRNKKILLLAPHPDDEIISSFYILRKATEYSSNIRVIFITSGENNYLCNLKVYKSFLPKRKYLKVREKEAKETMKNLKISNFSFWRFPDGKISQKRLEVFKKLIKEIKNFQPDIIISPSIYDTHKDHNIVGLITLFALELLKSQNISISETYYYIIHKNSSANINYDVTIKLQDHLKTEKLSLLENYKSQFLCNRNFFLRYINEESYISEHSLSKFKDPTLQLEFVGKDLIWIKVNKRNSILNPLKLNISFFDQGKLIDINSKISWNKEKLPLFSQKKLLAYATLQKLSNHESYIVLPNFKSEKLFIKLSNLNPVYDLTGYITIPTETKVSTPKTCVVIPCFNIAELCKKTTRKVTKHADSIVVVNDGSTDNTKEVLGEISLKHKNIYILNLKKNSGKGKALLEGIKYALKNIDFDLLITMDGDLQHRPKDIPLFKKAWINGGEVIFGIRKWNKKVPLRSKIGNFYINLLLSLFLRRKVKDSQSGFRGFDRKRLEEIVSLGCIKEGRYETELDFFLLSYLTKSRILEIEIPAIYFDNNESSHFNPVKDSFRIIKEFISFIITCKNIKEKNYKKKRAEPEREGTMGIGRRF